MATKAPHFGDEFRGTSTSSEARELLTLNLLASLTGLAVVAVGMVGLSLPGSLMTIVRTALTPSGMYLLAATRALLGLVLLVAAGTSRMPRTMRVFGVLLILSAIATPLIGFEGSRSAMGWLLERGDGVIRLIALVVLLGGGSLVYASGPSRRRM